MLLRTITFLVSILAHGLVGYAILPTLKWQETEVLDFGAGHNIELTPQGMIANEVTNLGDSVQSLETQEVIPVDQQSPTLKPPIDAPTKQLRDVADYVAIKAPREIASLEEQKPTPQAPAASSPEQLRDLPDTVARNSTQDMAALHDQNPTPQPSVITSTDPLANVDAVETKSTQAVAALPEQEPSPQRPILSPAKQLQGLEAKEKSAFEPDIVSASQPQLPEPVKALKSAKAGDLPPPEQLHDQVAQEEAVVQQDIVSASQTSTPDPLRELDKVTKADDSSPPEPVIPERPQEREVLAQPEQVAIVTELSSGEEKTGGDAKIFGIYLGKINAKVQRSKVNPRSQQTGNVLLKFTIRADGSLLSKQVESSSGYQVLDEAALAAIDRAAPFPAVPAEVGVKPMSFTQLFRFVVR